MRKTHFPSLGRNAGLTTAAVVAFWCVLATAQTPPVMPTPVKSPSAGSLQSPTTAALKDTLLAMVTDLYDSPAKTGLRSYDCQVHPDWKKMMSSAKKGAPIADDDPKLLTLGTVKIALHARMSGASTLDWQVPVNADKPLNQASVDLLNRMHQGIENTLLGELELSKPLVDGSIAESMGEDGVDVTQTADGYLLRSKNKRSSLTETFNRNLVLKHYVAIDSGSAVEIEPEFQPTPQGMLLNSFTARVRSADAPPASAKEMHVSLEYQTVSAIQIPARLDIGVLNLVEMDFAFDGCTVNSAPK